MISGLFERASPENPSTSLANPDLWLWDALGSYQSAAGVRVSPESAQRLAAVYACINVRAETLASVPCELYERTSRGSRKRATDHPLYPILHDQPNHNTAAFDFYSSGEATLSSHGNTYGRIVRANGRVASLHLLPSEGIRVGLDGQGQRMLITPKGEELRAGEFFHLRWRSKAGELVSPSPIRANAEVIGSGLAQQQYGGRFYKEGLRPAVAVTTPAGLSPEAITRLKGDFKKVYGEGGDHRAIFLEQGMTVDKLAITPADAIILEALKYTLERVCGVYRVPVHKVQHLERATFSNIEHAAIEFVTDCALPMVRRWEQTLELALLTPAERERFYIEFNLDGLLRGDTKSRFEAYSVGRQWGWLTANKILERENEELLPPEEGDQIIVPMNMTTPQEIAARSETGERSGVRAVVEGLEHQRRSARALRSVATRRRLRNVYTRIFEQAAGRLVRFEVKRLLDELRKARKGDEPLSDFLAAAEAFFAGALPKVYRRELEPSTLSYAEAINGEVEREIGEVLDEAAITVWVNREVGRRTAVHVGSSSGQIRQLAAGDEDPLDAIEGRLDEWSEKRGPKVAKSYVVGVSALVARAAYRSGGRRRLRWVSSGKDCPFCSQMDGRVVGIDDPFLEAGDTVEAEGRDPLEAKSSVFAPPVHGGCDCDIVSE